MNKNMTSSISFLSFGLSTLLLVLTLLFSTSLALAESSVVKPNTITASKAVTVVELFTSQGCSSCPKADRVFEKITKQPGVIALSYHVDYWDYLGWKDKMASANNSKRQRDYAIFRGDNSVFTPQVIINGDVSLIGGNGKIIGEEIKKQSLKVKGQVDVKLWEDEKNLYIEIGTENRTGATHTKASIPRKKAEGTIWLALIKKSEKIKIERGENRGKTITYHNVVHELSPIGRWMGEKMSIRLPRQQWMARGSDGCVVLLQQDGGKGQIRGAAQLISW